MNSCVKGKCGERSFAHYVEQQLSSHTYKGEPITCRRGQQHKGGEDSPDCVSNLPVHFEVKRTERLRLYDAVEQAICDGGDLVAVAHRANRKQWVAVVPMNQFLLLLVDKE
jgi:hypothetical protein